MKIINLTKNLGKHCFILDDFKIFYSRPINIKSNDILWGDKPKNDNPNMSVDLLEASEIQNFCAIHNLAPRVYEIVKVKIGKKYYLAQRTDILNNDYKAVTQDNAQKIYDEVKKLGKIYGFENEKDDVSVNDVIELKLVDFNTFHFSSDHKEKIKKLYIENSRYGKIYYHNIKEIGLINSPRDNDNRIKWMKLDKINFKNKTVIDLGCAGGFFSRYSFDQGAESVIGIDKKGKGSSDPIYAAKIISNELGYFNINYIDHDVLDLKNLYNSSFDIVFFLSMNFHIGIPEWLSSVTNEVCIFEDNSKERNALKTLEKMFKRVEKVGIAYDHGNKPIYHCYNK